MLMNSFYLCTIFVVLLVPTLSFPQNGAQHPPPNSNQQQRPQGQRPQQGRPQGQGQGQQHPQQRPQQARPPQQKPANQQQQNTPTAEELDQLMMKAMEQYLNMYENILGGNEDAMKLSGQAVQAATQIGQMLNVMTDQMLSQMEGY